jgi:hypothetical protein
LAEIAAHIGQLKDDPNAYLTDPNLSTLRLRLENAYAAVEAAMVERFWRLPASGRTRPGAYPSTSRVPPP